MILLRQSNKQTVSSIAFHLAMRLGRFYGWRPVGTLPPLGWAEATWERWEMDEDSYGWCLGEKVIANDAARWAAALAEALDDIPDEDVLASRVPFVGQGKCRSIEELGARFDRLAALPLPEVWSGNGKKWLRRFIAYLRQGGFVVEP